MKTIFKIFLCLSILIFLIECSVRILLKPIYISPNELKEFRKDISTKNRKGMKIAMLGDSFTYGSKVEENETIAYFLSVILKERLGRDDVYVDNFGISGTSTIEHYYLFNKHIKSSDYDFVVLNFFIDDFTPYYYNNSLLNPYLFCKEYEKGLEYILYYLSRLRLIELPLVYLDLFITYKNVGTSLTPVSYMLQKMREKDSLRYKCAKELLFRMGKEIESSNKKGVFVLIPSLTLYDSQNPYPEEISEYETMALLLAKHSGYEVIDTLAELREVLDQRMVIKNDIHYNAEGYKLITSLIADKIIEMLKR